MLPLADNNCSVTANKNATQSLRAPPFFLHEWAKKENYFTDWCNYLITKEKFDYYTTAVRKSKSGILAIL